jgi:hypothetical protein
MKDQVFSGFTERQFEEGMALAAASDILELIPADGAGRQRYLADFRCKGLLRTAAGEIVEADRFLLGIWFPDQYLRVANMYEVLTLLGPPGAYHPNISGVAPIICPGYLVPGTPLVDILFQCFEIITYQRVTMDERNALHPEACAWARRNQHRFPIDPRPLKRRGVDCDSETFDFETFEVETIAGTR